MNNQPMRTLLPISIFFFLVSFLVNSCRDKDENDFVFTVRVHTETGLAFANKLVPDDSMNMFTYMYFYNGAGVGAGDFNQDGLIDLFFGSNQGENKLYLNSGGLKFEDMTTRASIPQDGGWSTGISVVDINQDGLLDIYISRVGRYKGLISHNQLLVCQAIKEGIPVYEEKAAAYGLDFSGFSTQAVFFDMDRDNDLDLFLLNHAVHQNGSFAPRELFLGTYDSLSGDRLYKNENGRFSDITRESGINSSAIGYGLGVVVSDINLDGWPDLYIGNDFHENDYLYINQKDGTFSEQGEEWMQHTSQFSMGVDAADINNDGHPEIISADMLPSDPYILKRSLGEDDYDIFYHKTSVGYSYQYTRNNLQYNRGNGRFSEIGLYSDVYATDWSWAPLWMDFDNDGYRDLFISNGIPKRMNDIDYVSFISNQQVQQDLKNKNTSKALSLANRFPEIKIPNRFFSNNRNLSFSDIGEEVNGNGPSYSNGAVYADLDNDGDLDIVVNNVEDPVLLYENNTNDSNSSYRIDLMGPRGNRNAIGARVVVFSDKGLMTFEKSPVHGFASSMEIPILIGADDMKIDSAFLIWPDAGYEPLQFDSSQRSMKISYRSGLPAFDFNILNNSNKNDSPLWEDITGSTGIDYVHTENPFPEFNREPLIPHMVSTEGPAVAVADINGDGFEDFFIGASKTRYGAVFLQDGSGFFKKINQPALALDSMYEDVDAVWQDMNGDGYPDLVVASGGNEYFGQDPRLLPRLYQNDGKGNLTKVIDAFTGLYMTSSCLAVSDFNGDGHPDIFLGGRCVPWEYGETPRSYLLQNNGKGHFQDVTLSMIDTSEFYGMITDAIWADLDGDKKDQLILSYEWGGIKSFKPGKEKWKMRELTNRKGWWNFLKAADLDQDGALDLLAGNLGHNSRLKGSAEKPVRLYFNDFDNNGKREQVMTYYLGERELPFANKDELEKQIPVLKKKFLYAEDFAKAGLKELFGAEKLRKAKIQEADYFSNSVLYNRGEKGFYLLELPTEAQFTSFRDAVVTPAGPLWVGNFEGNNIQMGRYDADMGTLLVSDPNKIWNPETLKGLKLEGQFRHVEPIKIAGKQAWILVRNNGPLQVIRLK